MIKSSRSNKPIFTSAWAGWAWEVLWEAVDRNYIDEQTLGGIIDMISSNSEEDLKFAHDLTMIYHTRICSEKNNIQ